MQTTEEKALESTAQCAHIVYAHPNCFASELGVACDLKTRQIIHGLNLTVN